MTVKISPHFALRQEASRMLTVLVNAAKKGEGVFAQNMPGHSGVVRQQAAAYLRQCGVPVYARRAGEDSAWFLLLDEDVRLTDEWAERILTDVYAEMCRAHMALVGNPRFTNRANWLRSNIVEVSGWLNMAPKQIAADMTPETPPAWVTVILNNVKP
jgi:hypothetical protein